MKDDFTTNSHHLIYTFLFRKVGRMYFLSLGVKGLKRLLRSIYAHFSRFVAVSRDQAPMWSGRFRAQNQTKGRKGNWVYESYTGMASTETNKQGNPHKRVTDSSMFHVTYHSSQLHLYWKLLKW